MVCLLQKILTKRAHPQRLHCSPFPVSQYEPVVRQFFFSYRQWSNWEKTLDFLQIFSLLVIADNDQFCPGYKNENFVLIIILCHAIPCLQHGIQMETYIADFHKVGNGEKSCFRTFLHIDDFWTFFDILKEVCFSTTLKLKNLYFFNTEYKPISQHLIQSRNIWGFIIDFWKHFEHESHDIFSYALNLSKFPSIS